MQKKMTGYPSIDKPWLRYYSEAACNAKIEACSVYENIFQNNKDFIDDIALLYFGKKISYKKLFYEIDRIVSALRFYEVKESDNVIICAPAIPEAIYFLLALNCIGANAVMLNPTFTEQQLVRRMRETNAKLLFVASELYQCIKNAIPQTNIKILIECSVTNSMGKMTKIFKHKTGIRNAISWKAFLKRATKEPKNTLSYKSMRPAIMVYSSGTTGASKGIQLTNEGINWTILQYRYAGFHMCRQDRFFAQVPIWFSTGISISILVPLCLGITVILEPIYDFNVLYQHIIKYQPNFIITAVALLEYLKNNHSTEASYSNFKYLVIGGEYVSPVAEKKFNKWLDKNNAAEKLHKGWGMCECGGTITTTISKCNKIGSAGIPLPQVVVNAFSIDTDQPLKYGERGELRVQTPCKMLAYYKNAEATERYFWTDREGNEWACTGDMGYIDEDGNVYVDGRISDSYVDKKGEVIYLFDIERAILNIEEIQQCKVIATRVNGENTHVAHIVVKKGHQEILQKIKKFFRNKMPVSYMPRYFRLYDDALPVAPSGKIDTELMKNSKEDLIMLMD